MYPFIAQLAFRRPVPAEMLATPNLFVKDESATPNFGDEVPFFQTLWTSKFFYSARYKSMVEADILNLELDLGFGIYFRDAFQLNRITCYHGDEPDILAGQHSWKVAKARETVQYKMNHAVDMVCQAVTRKNVELWYLTESMWVNLSDKLHAESLAKTFTKREDWN